MLPHPLRLVWATLSLALTLALAPLAALARAPAIPDGAFLAISYHEVTADGLRDVASGMSRHAVEVSRLIAQFTWLRENGYRPVSLSDIAEARRGGKALPPKAVLLTFDDGYADFYTRAFPVLKLFGYPAVIALVGSWMDAPAGALVDYDGTSVPRERFMSWQQVREVVASGLVEVASHSYALHRGIVANPQGNAQPAATRRLYDPATRSYEDDGAYRTRVRDDLLRSVRQIERETGTAPRAIAWPYGRYNGTAQQIARELGMPLMLTLEGGVNVDGTPLDGIRRLMIEFDPDLGEFVDEVERVWPQDPERVVHVDLDQVYSADAEEQERNLSALLDRIRAIRPTTVYLQAFADPDGDGEADALYFPNRHLPVRADLFNRVAWQLETRANVRVYAWLPVLAFRLAPTHPAHGDVVQAEAGKAGSSYRRLSPFSARARATIAEIYADLGRHAHFSGLLFHDDAILGDHEDASAAALDVYRLKWGLPGTIDAIRADPRLAAEWSTRKTAWLIDFTRELAAATAMFTAPLKTARNLYAAPVLDPAAEQWFAQSLRAFLDAYDYTALMAMPYLEGAEQPRAFLQSLVRATAAQPLGLARTVFELQARDWRTATTVPTDELAAWVRQLELSGVRNIGYYPDDLHADAPALHRLAPAFSVRSLPEP